MLCKDLMSDESNRRTIFSIDLLTGNLTKIAATILAHIYIRTLNETLLFHIVILLPLILELETESCFTSEEVKLNYMFAEITH